MYLLSLSFTTHRQAAPVVWPGRLAVYGRNLEFTKSSRQCHEIAVFIPYDNTCSQATTCISHFSLSFYNTHRQKALTFCQGLLSSISPCYWSAPPGRPFDICFLPPVYQMSTKKAGESLGGQGVWKCGNLGRSTRCLPISLFYIESADFLFVSSVSLIF